MAAMRDSDRTPPRPRNIRTVEARILRENMEILRSAVPEQAKIMAVVKADGYGHGAVTAARAALDGGAAALAVATVAEGKEIREAGIRAVPILVLGAAGEDDAEAGIAAGLMRTAVRTTHTSVFSQVLTCFIRSASASFVL